MPGFGHLAPIGLLCILGLTQIIAAPTSSFDVYKRQADAVTPMWPFFGDSVTSGPTVHFNQAQGRLVYQSAANGDNLPDFSNAGYRRSNEPLPAPDSIPNRLTLTPSAADDTATIQRALDSISRMQPDSRGIRGALLLKAGTYSVSAPLNVTSGTVVRGEGSSLQGTVIQDTRTTISIPSYNGTWWVKGNFRAPSGTPIHITAEVPLGASVVRVSDASRLYVGQAVMVRGKMTPAFLASVNNSQVSIDRPDSWQQGMQLNQLAVRNITQIQGNVLFLDAPLFVRIGTSDMPGDLLPVNAQQASEVGFENLRGIAHFDGNHSSEAHTTNFIAFTGVTNSWVRNVTTEVYQTAVFHDYVSTDITVQDSACLMPKAPVWGGYRYAFPIRGSGMLYQRLYAFSSRHSYDIAGQASYGPNVYLDCYTNFTWNGADTHNPYAAGSLWDNVQDRRIFIRPRADVWNGMNCVVWNSACLYIDLEVPPNLKWYLWNIGSRATPNGHYRLQRPNLPGILQSIGAPVSPRSLFIQQLIERNGVETAAGVTSEAQLQPAFNMSAAMPSAQFWPAMTPPDPDDLGIIGP